MNWKPRKKIAEEKKESSLLRDRVTDEEIARIVARWTGIPVAKLVEGEREKLLRLADVLHQRVIGQDEAVTKGLRRPSCALVPVLLGSEQTSSAQLPVPGPHRRRQDRAGQGAWHSALFDDEKNMVRIDMTEYMEKFSVLPLIGAGLRDTSGYEEGGQLTRGCAPSSLQRRAVR